MEDGLAREPGSDGQPGGGDAAGLLAALERRGWTVACAESLTGGLVAAELVSVPGASRTVQGGVVSYAYDVKTALLGVPAEVLRAQGAVDPGVARQMALGARRACLADVGLSTTGVAGPDPADGQPVGTVYVAVALPDVRPVAGGSPEDGPAEGGPRVEVRRLALAGDRAAIRASAVTAVVALALDLVEEHGELAGR